ncbi:MAG TPA: glycosyltransferase [Bradyrhizobium sp.]|jgi:glycosyltransferase involved in cell wall biosynthesis|nr:glycosyltransferase [Bradyrhizobium sp.]
MSDQNLTPARRAPRVSVLVTTYNQARYVEEALDSLRRQTSREFEVIITDDASTDGSADVIAAWLGRTGYPAQFIRNENNRGICANRNAALARSSGSFVCSLSGDDCYEPDRIERQLACFLAQPESVGAVYSDMSVVDAEGRTARRSYLDYQLGGAAAPHGDLFVRIMAGNFLPAPAVMLRRSAIADVGGYDESLFYEDFDMWLRLSFRFHFTYLPGRLVRYRAHESSMSRDRSNQPLMNKTRTRILTKWLNAGLNDKTRRVVLNALMRNGAIQLEGRDLAGARETFNIVMAADPPLHQRVLARAGMLPWAGAGIRAWLPPYRRCRSLMRRLSSVGRARRR